MRPTNKPDYRKKPKAEEPRKRGAKVLDKEGTVLALRCCAFIDEMSCALCPCSEEPRCMDLMMRSAIHWIKEPGERGKNVQVVAQRAPERDGADEEIDRDIE